MRFTPALAVVGVVGALFLGVLVLLLESAAVVLAGGVFQMQLRPLESPLERALRAREQGWLHISLG